MKKKIFQYFIGITLALLLLNCNDRKTGSPFYVRTYNLKDSLQRLKYLTFINNNQLDTAAYPSDVQSQEWADTLSRVRQFFENEEYLVIGTSMGEFGGSIIFSDKKSDLNYFLNSMDPVMVDYRESYYYITIHSCDVSSGRTKILKLNDPKSLIEIHDRDLPVGKRQRDSIWHANSDFIERLNEEIVLIDTPNVTASMFYPYKGRYYLIYSAMPESWVQFNEIDMTFLGEIKNGSLITLDTILNEPTWTMDFEPSRVVNNSYSYKYRVDAWNGLDEKLIETRGRIFVMGDTIVIGHRHKDNRQHPG